MSLKEKALEAYEKVMATNSEKTETLFLDIFQFSPDKVENKTVHEQNMKFHAHLEEKTFDVYFTCSDCTNRMSRGNISSLVDLGKAITSFEQKCRCGKS